MKIYVEDNENIPAIKILPNDSIAPVGYTENTSIENLDNHAMKKGYDYKAVREQIKIVAATIGFQNLSIIEKELACRWFAVLKSDRDTVHSMLEQIKNGKLFHEASTVCRGDRLSSVISEIYNRLQSSEINELIDDTSDLTDKYINRGREGTLEGDPEGLFDYIEARAGTYWDVFGSNPGLKGKNWTPIGKTLDIFVNDLIYILKNGVT